MDAQRAIQNLRHAAQARTDKRIAHAAAMAAVAWRNGDDEQAQFWVGEVERLEAGRALAERIDADTAVLRGHPDHN